MLTNALPAFLMKSPVLQRKMKSIIYRHKPGFIGLFCIFCLSLLFSMPQAVSQPSHLHISLAIPEREQSMAVNVTWIHASDCLEQSVQYGRTPDYNKESRSQVIHAEYGCVHKSVLADLQPSTRYYYRVGSDMTGWSDMYSFKTAQPPGSSEPFKVAVFGDTQNNEFNTEFEKTERIIESLTTYNTDFSIHYGDIVVNGSYTDSWLDFIDTAQPLIAESPMMVTLGNHDIVNAYNDRFQQPYPIFYELFSMPGNGLDYSFIYGNAYFVCLYSGNPARAQDKGLIRYGPGSPERAWLERELEQARANPEVDWIIAYMHYPVYSYGPSNIAGWKEHIAPIFDKYGVDLCLAGHRHAYERHYPIFNGERADDNMGTVYITNGTSGGSPQGIGGFDLPTMAFTITERMYNYALMTISGKTLEYHVYDINDVLIDHFKMEK